ncbi:MULTISPECIES: FHA domain-containing protein [Mycobacterium]|uniref:ABC transporter ATP-binding protein n=1 Tax=Mycobacterium pseudoshottsii TaxID=265949 RepID=A0A9N7LRU3_9MYCO|nr:MULTISPECIES: FHA domain-containing protein [Mycobacterium]EPQ48743.1 ABC transporter ATP-binding protein [Mycobacterium sp. 012931]MBC9864484.1 Efflux transmembrane permease family [Mycobacterium pseudoshottsii]BBA87302.1 ABC transporter ATP-binding protein [Mycobacterium pseudoshottsii JCM 15466]BDN81463.1 ABC transporter ATP-binding protein [Mycobacterium pseudoshottsii]BEH75868.1 ABC transporter ATP-binding protein [Mycobacterium pseudoshottsii]
MHDRIGDATTNPPRLELRAAGRTWHATPNRAWTIGRAAEADIRLDNPRVSRLHAVLEPTPAGWVLVNRSRNGSFVGGTPVQRVPIHQPVTVLLGSASSGQAIELHPAIQAPEAQPGRNVAAAPDPLDGTTVARAPTTVHAIDQLVVTIGRGADNNVLLNDLLVSRRHAVLRRSGDQWELVDNHSANGTYVNGNRITRALIGPNDIVGIGHQLMHLSGDRLVEYVDTGDVSYEASNLRVVTKKGRVLLSDVSFVLPQRSLLAVVGPSGAGKSTLLGALTGFHPATSGTVRYDERDLYDNYAELRHRIGFVPQDDILHIPLTVRRALNYAAQLRFPQDVSAEERRQRIEEVLAELGLTTQADQRIDSLSGGQRKRTSVALELLTKPSLLFLDEPTSGLDPGYEKSVMQTLRSLADDGRSVVVVTHNIAHLNMCDRLLILAPGGRLAYFGPPQQALSYFNCTDFADLFTLLEQDKATDWTARFNASPLRAALTPHPAQRPAHPAAARTTKPVAQQSAFAQFAILCRRYVAVIAADRQYAVFLLVLPLLLSLFAHAVPGKAGLSLAKAIELRSTQPAQLLVLLIIGGALMGCAASIREIVKEQAIYRREHGIGMSGGAYLASKLVVLTALTTAQGLILGFLGPAFLPAPDQSIVMPWPTVEVAVAVVAVTVVSMMIGLLISAMIGNADRGMPLLVLVVMAQLVLCGGMFGVKGRIPLEQLAWLSPSRWAYAMAASTVDLNDLRRAAGGDQDPLWDYKVSSWLIAAGACVVQAAVLVTLIAWRLRQLDPQRKARR